MTEMHHISHPEADDLERLVLRSPVLSAERSRQIRLHLEICKGCAAEEARLVRFYAELAHADPSAFGERAAKFLSNLAVRTDRPAGNVIELFPVTRGTRNHATMPNVIVLAAQDTANSRRIVPVLTMKSSDEQTLLYVQKDTVLHLYHLQVLAENPETADHALLAFPPTDASFVTDESGECLIPEDRLPSTKELHALVRPASEHFDCGSLCVDATMIPPSTILAGSRGGTLAVTADADSVAFAYEPASGDVVETMRMSAATPSSAFTLDADGNTASVHRTVLQGVERLFIYR